MSYAGSLSVLIVGIVLVVISTTSTSAILIWICKRRIIAFNPVVKYVSSIPYI